MVEDKFIHDKNKDMQIDTIKQIEMFVREHLHALSHGFDHTRRVYNLCLHIGQVENAELKSLLPAALLHDIGRDLEEHLGADHAESAEYLAKDFLKQINYPKNYIEPIFEAIKSHRASNETTPQTVEARILSDADKLDSLGAIGIARVFTFGGSRGRDVIGTIAYFKSRLQRVQAQLFTETAKRIAAERLTYTSSFLKKMSEEDAGIR